MGIVHGLDAIFVKIVATGNDELRLEAFGDRGHLPGYLNPVLFASPSKSPKTKNLGHL
jgi:hypothetical protein